MSGGANAWKLKLLMIGMLVAGMFFGVIIGSPGPNYCDRSALTAANTKGE